MEFLFAAWCCIWLYLSCADAQSLSPEHKYSAQDLKADLAFVQQQLFKVHAYPYTELSKAQYEQVFQSIEAKITDSITATAFYKLIKPAVAYLSDEHAAIGISPVQLLYTYQQDAVYLPLTLIKKGGVFQIEHNLSADKNLQPGNVITQINNVPVADWVSRCAMYTTGTPGHRNMVALQQFGYLYTLANVEVQNSFQIRTGNGQTVTLQGVPFNVWQDYRSKIIAGGTDCPERVAYRRIEKAGYITACSFDTKNDKDFDSLSRQIADIFKQIDQDKLQYLFIDVSNNSGGNSAVGDVLINYIYSKSYLGYQCNFKRSDEYLQLIKSWGISNPAYAAYSPGTIIHSDAEIHKPAIDNPYRFKGKVFVVVGNGTFSSAIMFATVIKDNHIATLIGQMPQDGHPNHFGELYNTQLPHTQLTLRFGVKEWIRPTGKIADNNLHPDRVVDLGKFNSPELLIKSMIQ